MLEQASNTPRRCLLSEHATVSDAVFDEDVRRFMHALKGLPSKLFETREGKLTGLNLRCEEDSGVGIELYREVWRG